MAPALVVNAGKAVDFQKYEHDPFAYQNALFSQLLGRKVELYKPVDITTKRERTLDRYTYKVPQQAENTITYFSVHTRGWAHGKLYCNDRFMTEYAYWLTPQAVMLPQKDTTSGTSTIHYKYLSGENKIEEAYCYSLDLDALAAVSSELNAKTPAEYRILPGEVTAAVRAETGDESLYLSVPVDRGWTVELNGAEVDPQVLKDGAFADCFYLIPLEEGENTVKMTYEVPGLKAGAVITVVTFLASLALAIFFRKKKAK